MGFMVVSLCILGVVVPWPFEGKLISASCLSTPIEFLLTPTTFEFGVSTDLIASLTAIVLSSCMYVAVNGCHSATGSRMGDSDPYIPENNEQNVKKRAKMRDMTEKGVICDNQER